MGYVASQTEKLVKILFIDDDPLTRHLFQKISEPYRCAVLTASCYEDAMKVIQALGLPDLIMLDLKMPDVDGVESFKRLSFMRPAIPVIIFSGFIDEKAVQAIQDIGYGMFAPKPRQLNKDYLKWLFSILRIRLSETEE